MPVPVTCQRCGIVFQSPIRRGKTRKFCSKSCYDKAQRGPRPDLCTLQPRQCLQCEEWFRPTDNSKKFCSRSCSASYHHNPAQRGSKPSRVVPCKICGTEFKRNRVANVFCSHWCYLVYRRRPLTEKQCTVCESTYPLTREYFNRSGAKNGRGWKPMCRWCHAAGTRARTHDVVGRYSFDEVWQMYEDQGGMCAYCETPLFGVYHIDHMIPLSRGGRNDWTNLAIACQPCNNRKYTKTAEEFVNALRGRRGEGAA